MILVTGATGFVGSELVRQLSREGKAVRAIKRESSLIPAILQNDKNIDWRNADLLDYFSLQEAMEGITHVYHCAARVSFEPKHRKQMLKTNVEGTSNLVNLCLDNNIYKLVHVSSVAAVGEAKPGMLNTEQDHWKFDPQQGGYAISKYESEMEVFRGIAEGLNAVIVNPSVIIGVNAGKEGSGQFFETVRRGLKFYPSGSCGFVDVADVARCMIALMDSEISGQRFVINSENISYRDLFSQIAEGFRLKAPSIALKPWMLSLAFRASQVASALSGKDFGLTKDTVRSAFKQQNYSSKKVMDATGIRFKPVRQSIAEICRNWDHSN